MKTIICLVIAGLAVLTVPLLAEAGDSRVNTMAAHLVLPQPSATEVQQGAAAIKVSKNLKIPPEWVPLLNRAYEEYWLEGNHRPDAGFVLFARNPSKDAAKLWLLRMESKAQNLELLFRYVKEAQQDLVTTGLMADRYNMVNQASVAPVGTSSTLNKISAGSKRLAGLEDLQFYFLFSPTCSHCAHLAQSLLGFPNVHPLQVTDGEIVNWPGLPSSDRATAATIALYVKDGTQGGGVPVLAIYQPKTQQVLKMRGAHSAEEILTAAAAVQSQPKTKWAFPGPLHPSILESEQIKRK